MFKTKFSLRKVAAIAALAIVAVAFAGCKEEEEVGTMNSVVFTDENDAAIDTLYFGGDVNSVRTFKMKNQGNGIIHSWMCYLDGTQWCITAIDPDNGLEFKAGDEVTITITIDGAKIKGDRDKAILLVSDARSSTKTSLPLVAVRNLRPVVTGNAGVINATSARLRGEITATGEPAYTERGFVYSTTTEPTVENGTKVTVAKSADAKFSANVEGLTSGQTYYMRAYAVNTFGTAYSGAASFTPSADYGIVEVHTESSGSLAAHTHDVGNGNWATAKCLCETSAVGGFDDWRLPSKDELLLLYERRNDFGNFVENGDYWSSTAFSHSNSGLHFFRRFEDYEDPIEGSFATYDTASKNVRCVRSVK